MSHLNVLVSCRHCGRSTPMLGTQMCDRCWELDHRIRGDVQLARKILLDADPELQDTIRKLSEYPLEAFYAFREMKPDTPVFGANEWRLNVGDVLTARELLK